MPVHVGGQRISRIYRGASRIRSVRRGEHLVFRSYSDQAQALFNAMTVKPDEARRALIEETIKALIDAGVWAKLDCLYLHAAHHEQAGRLNWRNPAQFALAAVNTPTFTTDRGFAGNGSTSYLDSGFNPSTAGGVLVRNSAHLGAYLLTNSVETQYRLGNAGLGLIPHQGSGFAIKINTTTGNSVGTGDSSAGYFLGVRTNSSDVQGYIDGAITGTASRTSQALVNANLLIGSNNGTFNTNQFACAHWGAALTGTDAANLNSIIAAYLTALGAI